MKRTTFNSVITGFFSIGCIVLLSSALYLNPKTSNIATHDGIHNIDYPETQFLGVRGEVAFDQMESFYQKNLPASFMAASANGFTISGKPTGLFFVWDEENSKTEMMAGVAVSGEGNVPEGFTLYTVQSGKALQLNYYGPYEGSGKAHEKLDAHMKEKNLEFLAPAMETYVTDPMVEKDPNKWLTVITYLVK